MKRENLTRHNPLSTPRNDLMEKLAPKYNNNIVIAIQELSNLCILRWRIQMSTVLSYHCCIEITRSPYALAQQELLTIYHVSLVDTINKTTSMMS